MNPVPANPGVLSAMIAPALFLTASGSLIISTSNRLARVGDRVRDLCESLDRLSRDPASIDFVPERIGLIEDLLNRLTRRIGHIRVALTLLYLALACFGVTSLSLAVDVWLGNRIAAVPTGLAVVGVLLLVGACLRLAREAITALNGESRESRFYRELHRRRSADRNP